MNTPSCYEAARLLGRRSPWHLIPAFWIIPVTLFGQAQHETALEMQVRGGWLSAEYCSSLNLTQNIQAVWFRSDNLMEWQTASEGPGRRSIGRYAIVSEPSGPEPGVRSVSLIVAPVSYPDALMSSVLLLTWTNFNLDLDSRFPPELGSLIKAVDLMGKEVLFVRNTTKLALRSIQDPGGPRFELLFEGPFRIDTALEQSRNLLDWSLAAVLTNRCRPSPPWTEVVLTNAVTTTSPVTAFYRAVLFPEWWLEKHLVATNRLTDIAPSADGEWAWAATEVGTHTVLRLSARTGEVQESLGMTESVIQRVFFTGGTLIAMAYSWQDPPPAPQVALYDTQPHLFFRQAFRLPDWRLYRVGSAALSLNGQLLWATSAPNMSSLYGRVYPALFRIGLEDGTLQRILGPPPDALDNEPGADLPEPLVVSIDAQGALVVSDPAMGAVRWFSNEAIEQPGRLALAFVPTLAPTRVNQFLPLIGGTKGVVLDTVAKKVISRFQLPGQGTAVCVDGPGMNLYVATAGSSKVLQLEARTGSIQAVLDLSRPGGVPDIVDSARGKETADIVKLQWLDNPPRLLALGFDGSVIIVADL